MWNPRALTASSLPGFVAAALLSLDVFCSAALSAPQLEEVAPSIHLQRGEFKPGAQPDGNSVLIVAPQGVIVIDTGRHVQHTQGLIDFSMAKRIPVSAIVNTHWHLDHIGGNARLREHFPQVRVYASGALHTAMQGFLAEYRRDLQAALETEKDESKRGSLQTELALLVPEGKLAPDEILDTSVVRSIAGKTLEIHLEKDAVTSADLWLFDPVSRVLVSGDLVTLPFPLFDTACAQRWREVLDRLDRIKFNLLLPGHGRPLDRAGFATYRRAVANFLDCADSTRTEGSCAQGWLDDAALLLSKDEGSFATDMAQYYLANVLRNPKARAKYCPAAQ